MRHALRARAAAVIARCCWSAMRPITAASASPPRRPAACGCRVVRAQRLLACELVPARSTARAAPRPRPAPRRFERSRNPWPLPRPPNPQHRWTPRGLAGGYSVRQTADMTSVLELTMTKWPVHARIDGPIVMIGFGSIGKGTLPLIERHFEYDKSRGGHRPRGQGPQAARPARHPLHPPGRHQGELPRLLTPLLTRAAAKASASTCRSTPPRST